MDLVIAVFFGETGACRVLGEYTDLTIASSLAGAERVEDTVLLGDPKLRLLGAEEPKAAPETRFGGD